MKFLTHSRISLILVIVCVVVGFFLRMNHFDSNGEHFFFVDVARDYIVSHHTIAYGEIPLTGSDGYAGTYLSSPFYYWMLSLILVFHDDVFFPGTVNVLLQTLCIVLVFLLAKELFGRTTALVATFFFTFFDAVVEQSFMMWQPYLMQPFLLTSFLLLALSFTREKITFLYCSTVLFAGALMLHNSVLAVLPIYVFIAGFILVRKNASAGAYLKTGLSFLLPLFLLLLPVIVYFAVQYVPPVPLSETESLFLVPPPPPQSIADVFHNFVPRIVYFFAALFEGEITSLDLFTPTAYTTIGFLTFLAGSVLYLYKNKGTQRGYFFALLIGALFCTAGAVATLGLLDRLEFPVRYFTPVYALVLIAVAELIVRPFHSYTWLFIPKSFVVITILCIASYSVPDSFREIWTRVSSQGTAAFSPVYTIPEDVAVLANTIQSMPKVNGSLPQFDVRTFERDYEHQYLDSKIWLALEKIFATKLVRVDDDAFRGFAVPYIPKHLFVRCISNTQEVCESSFLQKYSLKYKIIEVITATPEVVYLHAIRYE